MEARSRWVKRARGAHQGMGEGPKAAGNLRERWGMRMRSLMRSLLSQEMWMVTSCSGGHLGIDRKRKNKRILKTLFLCRGIVMQSPSAQISRYVNPLNFLLQLQSVFILLLPVIVCKFSLQNLCAYQKILLQLQ